MKKQSTYLFDKFSGFYDFTRSFWRSQEYTASRIMKLIAKKKINTLVDLGGGSGSVTRHLIAQRKLIIDPSPGMLAASSRKGLAAIKGTAESIPLKDNSCDVVVCTDSFHHFTDQEKAVKEIWRVLKAKGIAAIEEINPETFFGSMLRGFENAMGMNSRFQNPGNLSAMFIKAGFKTDIIDGKKTIYYMRATK